MGDGSLSQEEIDALLQGADDLGASMETEPALPEGGLSDTELQQLRVAAQEMAKSMAGTLSTITSKSASIQVSRVDVMMRDSFASQFSGRLVQVSADFVEGAPGLHSYVLSEHTAGQVAGLMMAQEGGELTEMAMSALTESFSQMSGAALNVLGSRTGVPVKGGDLNGSMVEDPSSLDVPEGEFLRIRYDFTADGAASSMDEVMDMSAAKKLAESMVQAAGPAPAKGGGQAQQFQQGFQQQPPVFSTGGGGQVGVQPVQFSPLSQGEQTGTSGNIGLLMDVSMQLTVELGRTKMLIKDILGMGEGTIVELDKLAGEPVDLLVNGKLIAKGEVVVIDENFGVRVTDIISPMERISNLE